MIRVEQFIKYNSLGKELEIREELEPVVQRIAKVLPVEVIWDMYSSTPEETGGRVIFPYSRVDSSVIVSQNCIHLCRQYLIEGNRVQAEKLYKDASMQAMEALVWIEIGFLGLENLAKSDASRNWTSAVGHNVGNRQREIGILTTGREMMTEKLKDFVEYRQEHEVKNDCFDKYGVAYLLDPYK